MRENKIKKTLRGGGVALGTFVFEFSSTGIGRLAAKAGADFIIFDMEHTGWSVETIRGLLATTGGADIVPLVRVPAAEYDFIARVLDMGAMGVMVPTVETAQQALALVAAAKYPPEGRRGAAFGMLHDDYDGGDIGVKIESANRETLLVAQVETVKGLENVEKIAAVAGIDMLWVGQTDLSTSLGIPGQFTHPEFDRALDRILEVAGGCGKPVGYMALSVEEGRALLERGFRSIAYGGDSLIYQRALREGLDVLRESS